MYSKAEPVLKTDIKGLTCSDFAPVDFDSDLLVTMKLSLFILLSVLAIQEAIASPTWPRKYHYHYK